MNKINSTKKRTAILKTTQSLILEFGVDKISIREIAKIAGVSQVTIYNHFEDKDTLIEESLKLLINKTLEFYEEIINSENSFNDKLKEIFNIRKAFNKQKIWYSLVKISKHDSYVEKMINNLYQDRLKESLLKLINQGKKEKQINAKTSEKALLIYINIFKDYYFDLDNALLLNNDPILVKDLWELFWQGIKG
jgi:AcrR family transcriptional regulator